MLQAKGWRRLRMADLTGVQDVQVQQCPCGRALGRWGCTELLCRTCCQLQTEPCTAQRPIQVLADHFVTDGNFKVVVQALEPIGPTPLQLHCPSFRADSLDPGQLLHVLRPAGPQELHRLEVVHNVRLHAGHVQQLLTQDCYTEGAAYPQDELAMSKFNQQKYDEIARDLHALLLQAGRDDIQACTPVFRSFDPDVQETSNELGMFLLQTFKSALENSRALEQME
ncbi:Leucine-rich repeat-containing protein 14B [Manis javanica]|nr:Leucine-rich repeat-containing protein 14B [Manis javanica]